MMFTAEHYWKLAEILFNFNASIDKQELVRTLCDMFKEDNPKFNEVMFTTACYDEGGE